MEEAVGTLKRIIGEIARDNEDVAIALVNSIAELSILPREVTADICVEIFGSVIDERYNREDEPEGMGEEVRDIPAEASETAEEFGVHYVAEAAARS